LANRRRRSKGPKIGVLYWRRRKKVRKKTGRGKKGSLKRGDRPLEVRFGGGEGFFWGSLFWILH